MKTYLITDRAGPYLAGIRVASIALSEDGQRRITLSDAAAAYELGIGSIETEPAVITEANTIPKPRKGEAKASEAE